MSEDGDVDVESADDVPDIGVEATATTANANGDLYGSGGHNDKRAHHNALERRRRDHIKDSFHGLRDCIPSLVGEKVSRAHILNKATEYIRHMQKGGSTREEDICDLARKNEILEEQVQALEDARACGGNFSAEELLHGVASRVQARQEQEVLQLQAKSKSSSKSKSRATPSNPAPNATTTSAGHPSATGSSGGTPGVDKKPSGGSKGAADAHAANVSLPSNINILASNLKNTQTLLSALQKNNNLPPNIKSLAARVFPLIRGAASRSAQAVPRGIVTATTVPKNSNLSSSSPSLTTPTSATPTSKPSSQPEATGTGSSQAAESANISATSLTLETKTAESAMTMPAPQSAQEVGGTSTSHPAMPLSSEVGVSDPSPSSLLTSQLLEAHNILQQQSGGSCASSLLDMVAGDPVDDVGGVVNLVATPPSSNDDGSSASSTAASIGLAQGLNISPELLMQVSSFLNLPAASALSVPPTSSSSLPTEADIATLLTQDTSSPLVPSQATPTDHAPNNNSHSNNSHKRPAPASTEPPVPAKRPHPL